MASIARTAGTVGALLALCGAAGAVAGCAGGSSSGSSGGVSMSAASAPATGNSTFDSALPAAGSSGSGGGVAETAKASQVLLQIPAASVIKTATLDLRITRGKMQAQVDRARGIARLAGGFIASSHSQTAGARSTDITMRVPAARFEQAVTSLKGLGKVSSASEAGQDITRELIDLNARLVNLQAQRKVLLGLMNRATTISASIQVENELSAVQGQIEQLQGQLRYLHDRAAYSTITLSMVTAGAAPAPPQHASAMWQALSRSADAAQSVVTAVIVGAGFVIPIALLVGLVAILARRFRPGQVAESEPQS